MQHMDMDKALGVIWMFILAAGVVVGVLWYAGIIPLQFEDHMIAYSNPRLGVALQYPSSWSKEESEERYIGNNGFFGIDAVSASDTASAESIAQDVIAHRQKPYGASPHIVPLNIKGQDARLIYPSSDQVQRAGVLIVSYPRPITVDDQTFSFFVLYADVKHLQSLAESVTFLRP